MTHILGWVILGVALPLFGGFLGYVATADSSGFLVAFLGVAISEVFVATITFGLYLVGAFK